MVSSSDSGPSSIICKADGDASKDADSDLLSVGDPLGLDSGFDIYSFIPFRICRGSGLSGIGHSCPQYVTSGRVESSAVENCKLNNLLQACV